jgi:serine protease
MRLGKNLSIIMAVLSNTKWRNNQSSLVLLVLGVLYLSLHPARCRALSVPPVQGGIGPVTFRSLDIGGIAPNKIIFRVRPGVSQAEVSRILASRGIRGVEANIRTGFQRAVLSGNNSLQVAALLNQNPAIEYAEPDYLARAELIPNDPYFIYQWNFSMINMELAWDLSIGRGVTVAVVDTGVAFENNGVYAKAPDLAGTLFAPGWDFVNNDAYPDDDNGHGTHITGTIAQTTNNLLGVAGIAYGCTIMPVKVLDSDSNGLFSNIANGIYYAVNNGAKIINMSFGTYTASVTLQDAVNYAYQNGVSIIASAGNNASSIPHYPSSYPSCVCVSAVRYDKTRPFYSNYGPDVDICAPGGDLTVDQNLDGHPDGICQQAHDGTAFTQFNYALFQGTSCAAAHASGVAALVQSAAGGSLSTDALKSTLETTSIDLGAVGWDQDFGWGLVDALTAVQSVLPGAAVAGSLLPWLAAANPLLNRALFPLSQPDPLATFFGIDPFNLIMAELASPFSLSIVIPNSSYSTARKSQATSTVRKSQATSSIEPAVISNALSVFNLLNHSPVNLLSPSISSLLNPLAYPGVTWLPDRSYFQQPLNPLNPLSTFINPLSLSLIQFSL